MATIIGSIGNDSLLGTIGNDLIKGLQGNDTLVSSLRNDVLDGADGIDTANYLANGVPISLLPQGVVNKGAGKGTDTLVKVERIVAPVGLANTVDLSPSGVGITTNTNLATRQLQVVGAFVGNFTIDNFLNVIGSTNSDTIVGSIGNNNLSGGDSNDSIKGANGNDTINGGNGNDTLYGGNDNDTFIGSFGNDILKGESGLDLVDYSTIGQAISLLPQGIINKGSAGTDNISSIETIIAPTTTINTIDASSAGVGAPSINVNLTTNSLSVSGIGSFTVRNFTDVIGTGSNDTLVGNTSNNILDGRQGNDSLDGFTGNDTLYGSPGSDVLAGNTGIDTADYSKLTDAIVLGPTGTITKTGRNSSNQLINAGNDQLVRVETIIAPPVVPNDVANTIDASSAFGGITVKINLLIEQLSIPGIGAFGIKNFNQAFGTSGNDVLVGNRNGNGLVGLGGSDIVSGSDGSDFIVGADFGVIDFNLGFLERDTLIGGSQSDLFVLGDPFDIFFGVSPYYVGDGNNDLAVIEDYQPGVDRFFLDGVPSNYQVSGSSIFFNTGSSLDLIATANQNISPFDLQFSNNLNSATRNQINSVASMLDMVG